MYPKNGKYVSKVLPREHSTINSHYYDEGVQLNFNGRAILRGNRRSMKSLMTNYKN